MDCERARRAVFDRGLGALPLAAAAALERHLRACAGCRAHADAESRIDLGLSWLRRELPDRVDVTDRVLARVGEEPVPREISDRQLVWSSAWVAAASLGALGAAAVFHPTLLRWMRFTGAMAEGALRLAASLAGAAYGVVAELVPPTSWPGLLSVVALASGLCCCAVVLSTTAIVLGRDLRRARATPGREEG